VKVALLGPYPGEPGAGLAGGVDAVVLSLANGLAGQRGVELHVLTSVPGLRRPCVEKQKSFTLHRLPHPRGDRLLWHQPAVWPVLRALRALKPDVIHAHMAGHYADAALQSGRPTVITLHGVVFREAALALAHSPWPTRARWALDAWYERWILRRAREVIAISPYVAQEYRPFTRARFHEIENPVDDLFFTVPPLAGQAKAWGQGPLLLCVARLIPRKDILTLLDAFARVGRAFPDATLDIAGQTDADPAYTATCRERISRLGLEGRVFLLGPLDRAGLAARYARADVVLLTSRQETAPVAVAEAMAAGRPVVATRVGGVPYMVRHGETGFLAAAGDADAIAQATLRLLTQPGLAQAFGQAARAEAVQRFQTHAVVERTLALYRMLSCNQAPEQCANAQEAE